MHCRYQLNLRYPGQNWSLTVDAATRNPGARPDLSFADDTLIPTMMSRFHQTVSSRRSRTTGSFHG
jgi:hypothetical protein